MAAVAFAALGGCQLISQGHNAEGVRMYQQAYYEGALQQFQRALDADPQNPDSYYNLGATHHQLAKLHKRDADYTQAESYYNQCIDKSPNHEECYRGLAVLLVETDAFDLAKDAPGRARLKTRLDGLYEKSCGLSDSLAASYFSHVPARVS